MKLTGYYANYAVIEGLDFVLTPLEVMRIIATRWGWDEVDVEPIGGKPGYCVTARTGAESFSETGIDLDECCKKFCRRLLT